MEDMDDDFGLRLCKYGKKYKYDKYGKKYGKKYDKDYDDKDYDYYDEDYSDKY